MVRDAAELKARTLRPTNPGGAVDPSLHMHDWQIGERLSELQAAVDRVVHAEHPDNEDEREALSEFLDSTYDGWLREPDRRPRHPGDERLSQCGPLPTPRRPLARAARAARLGRR